MDVEYFTGGLSLNHDITLSLGLRSTPKFQQYTPDLHRHTSVRVDPYPFIAYQGAKTLCIHIIWMWDALHGGYESLNHDITSSLGLRFIPYFPKNPPPTYTGILV